MVEIFSESPKFLPHGPWTTSHFLTEAHSLSFSAGRFLRCGSAGPRPRAQLPEDHGQHGKGHTSRPGESTFQGALGLLVVNLPGSRASLRVQKQLQSRRVLLMMQVWNSGLFSFHDFLVHQCIAYLQCTSLNFAHARVVIPRARSASPRPAEGRATSSTHRIPRRPGIPQMGVAFTGHLPLNRSIGGHLETQPRWQVVGDLGSNRF